MDELEPLRAMVASREQWDCEVRHARAQFIYPPIWGRGDRYISPGITEMNINRDIHKICI